MCWSRTGFFSDLSELQAFETRIPYIEFTAGNREIAALMRSIALRGYQIGDRRLHPRGCGEVAEVLIRESGSMGRQLDVRMLINGFADRVRAEDHDAGCCWQDLAVSNIRGRPSVAGDVEPLGVRQQKKARELAIAREVAGLPRPERLEQWNRRTKQITYDGTSLSESTLYRRLGELGRDDAVEFGI